MRSQLVGTAIAFLSLTTASGAASQSLSRNGVPLEARLEPGVSSSPQSFEIRAGGDLDAGGLTGLPPGCSGWISETANFRLDHDHYPLGPASTRPLVFELAGDTDARLLIAGPDGWRCSGPGAAVRINRPRGGSYLVWVGATSGQSVPATLVVSDLPEPANLAEEPARRPAVLLDPEAGSVEGVLSNEDVGGWMGLTRSDSYEMSPGRPVLISVESSDVPVDLSVRAAAGGHIVSDVGVGVAVYPAADETVGVLVRGRDARQSEGRYRLTFKTLPPPQGPRTIEPGDRVEGRFGAFRNMSSRMADEYVFHGRAGQRFTATLEGADQPLELELTWQGEVGQEPLRAVGHPVEGNRELDLSLPADDVYRLTVSAWSTAFNEPYLLHIASPGDTPLPVQIESAGLIEGRLESSDAHGFEQPFDTYLLPATGAVRWDVTLEGDPDVSLIAACRSATPGPMWAMSSPATDGGFLNLCGRLRLISGKATFDRRSVAGFRVFGVEGDYSLRITPADEASGGEVRERP